MSAFSHILLNTLKIGVPRAIERKPYLNILEHKRTRMEGARGDEIEIYAMSLVIARSLWRWAGKYSSDLLICAPKLGIVNRREDFLSLRKLSPGKSFSAMKHI